MEAYISRTLFIYYVIFYEFFLKQMLSVKK